jgi:hypothetical protein
MSLLGDLERFASGLYPYRWPITIALIVVLVALLAVAMRRGVHAALWRHRLMSAAIAIPLLAVALPVGYYTISPFWRRSHLEEASPLAAAASPAALGAGQPTATVITFVPRVARAGEFSGADDLHFGRGRVMIIESAPGRYVLRVEEFSVQNGPDLFVYLTPAEDGKSVDGSVNLGGLKATDGSFNYEIPAGTDIASYRTAIVWCRKFSELFAVARLRPA